MTTTDTQVSNLIINTLTKAQYDSITPSATELYMVTDEVLYSAGTGIDATALQNGTLQVSTTIASKTDIGTANTTITVNGTVAGTINANATTDGSISITTFSYMPDYTAGISLSAGQYTPTSDGLVIAVISSSAKSCGAEIRKGINSSGTLLGNVYTAQNSSCLAPCVIPVNANENYYISTSGTITYLTITFYPYKGA